MQKYIIILGFLLYAGPVVAQNADVVTQQLQQLPHNFHTIVEKKYASINKRLTKKTDKYLKKLQREENKLYNKLSTFDTANAEFRQFSSGIYDEFKEGLLAKKATLEKVNLGEYNSWIDSLGISLSFLEQYEGLSEKIKLSSVSLDRLKEKLNETGKIQTFIAGRRQHMKDALAKYTHLHPALQKQYEKVNKTAYYYKAQVQEYKNLLKDPQKIEAATMKVLNKIPAFQNFMRQNSQLSSLFALPQDFGNVASLSGLQTRSSVQQMMQQRIAFGGPGAMHKVQQNFSLAQAEMNKLKDKLNEIANGIDDPDMPDFRPNTQKTKSFLKRLEYGFDVQFSKSKSPLPSGSDIGLSVGYKPNDKSLVGIGLSYKMGLGTYDNFKLTSEGLGLRSFVDYKIKNEFFLSGGYEINYLSGFDKIEELNKYAAWQQSALIGLSKKYKVSKKFKGEMKLLFDVLHRSHTPVSQLVVWRLGYKL